MECKDCKYWAKDEQTMYGNTGVKRCTKVKMLWDCTKWGEEDDDYERVLADEAGKAFVQDGSDYYACLLTLGDFGCNQFEPQ